MNWHTLALPGALTLHVLAAIVWVGGMFFAHMVLRPQAARLLEPPQRLPLWTGVFGRFFPWVWACIVILLGTGLWMTLGPFGGMGSVALYIHLMLGLGILMAVIFAYLFFGPYAALRHAVAAQDWPAGAAHLARIRLAVTANLVLGLATSAIAAGGSYFA